MKDILVTGGAGFIGSHVVNSLIEMGRNVIVLDDLSGGFKDNINPKATFVKGSILNNKLITSIFESRRIGFVFHLAAYAAEGLSHFIKRFNYKNNLIGSVNLINASINFEVECFVFTSSIAVYGNNKCPMTEDMIPLPIDSYGIAKFAVEQELKISNELFGLNYIIFRPHNVYGEMQNLGDKYRNVLGIFMNQIMQGKPLTIFGEGKQTRAFSYIKDVSPVIANSVFQNEVYNQIFNVGADKHYTVNELAKIVSKAMNTELNIRHVEERDEAMHAYCSHEKIKNVLGFSPEYSLDDGVKYMVEWALKSRIRKSKNFKGIEVQKNLPKVWLE